MQEYQKVFKNQNGYADTNGRFYFAFLGDGSEMDIFDTLEEAKAYLEKPARCIPCPASFVLIPSG